MLQEIELLQHFILQVVLILSLASQQTFDNGIGEAFLLHGV